MVDIILCCTINALEATAELGVLRADCNDSRLSLMHLYVYSRVVVGSVKLVIIDRKARYWRKVRFYPESSDKRKLVLYRKKEEDGTIPTF